MRLTRQSLNIATMAATNIVGAALGLLTIPFLIRQLGAETYGVWTLIVVVATYFTLIDFGVTIATGRLIAARLGAGDEEGVDTIISVAFVTCAGIAAICLVLALIVAAITELFLNIPPGMLLETRYSIFVSGAGVAIYFLFATFSGILWAYERFDLVGGVEMLVQAGRAAVVFLFVKPGATVLELSVITLGGHLAGGILLFLACRSAVPRFRIRLERFSIDRALDLVRQGFGFFTVNASRTLIGLLSISAVGNRLSPADVTAYSVARQLVSYGNGFLIALTQTAASRAVHFHASDQRDRQRELFSHGAVYATACAFFIVGGFLLLGYAFIQLWQGGRLVHTYPLLVILALGELLPMSQWVTSGIVMGMERHGRLIRLLLLEAACAPLSAVLVAPHFDLIGICVVLAINATFFRGIMLLRIGIKLLDRSVWRYVIGTILPIAVLSGGLIGVFFAYLPAERLTNWPAFVGAAGIYSACYGALFWLGLRYGFIRPQEVSRAGDGKSA